MLPISELPAAAPEMDSSPKRALLSELVVVISMMKTEGLQTTQYASVTKSATADNL